MVRIGTVVHKGGRLRARETVKIIACEIARLAPNKTKNSVGCRRHGFFPACAHPADRISSLEPPVHVHELHDDVVLLEHLCQARGRQSARVNNVHA